MGHLKNLPVILAILSFSALISSLPTKSSSANLVQWIQVSNDDLPDRGLDIAGIDNGRKLYLAQVEHHNLTHHLSYTMPAVLNIDRDIKATFSAWFGTHSHQEEFRVLDAPRGSLSWIPYPAGSPVPANAVIGGYNGDIRENYHICRVHHSEGNVIPGRLWPSANRCHYGFDGKEYYTKDNVEFLIINELGLAMGVTNA